MVATKCLGFLVLAAPPAVTGWTEQDRALVPNVAAFLAQAIANSHQLEDEIAARQAATADVAEDRETAAELDRLNAELSEVRAQLAAAEAAARMVPAKPKAAEAAAVAGAIVYGRVGPEPIAPVVPEGEPTTALAAIIEEAVTLVLPSIREKGLQLDLALPSDIPTVAVSSEVVQQLVVSLLDNACRASVEDSAVLLRADLAAANGGGPNGRMLRITVADSGVGIRPEDQEHVFDSNYYLSGGRPIAGMGDSGTNLAVVQKLAQASGGNISLKSAEGQGTAFSLSLPVTGLWSEGPTAPPRPAPGAGTKRLREPAAEPGS
jgi:signal transduction histidine kinase